MVLLFPFQSLVLHRFLVLIDVKNLLVLVTLGEDKKSLCIPLYNTVVSYHIDTIAFHLKGLLVSGGAGPGPTRAWAQTSERFLNDIHIAVNDIHTVVNDILIAYSYCLLIHLPTSPSHI